MHLMLGGNVLRSNTSSAISRAFVFSRCIHVHMMIGHSYQQNHQATAAAILLKWSCYVACRPMRQVNRFLNMFAAFIHVASEIEEFLLQCLVQCNNYLCQC